MIDLLHQKPLLGRQINWAHPLAKGLIGCWVMNEGSGNKLFNLVNREYNLDFVNSPIWVPGEIGYSVLFDDGSNQYLNFPGEIGILDYPFSFFCGFNTDVQINQTLMGIGSTGGGNDYYLLRLRDPADSDVLALSRTGTTTFASSAISYSVNTNHRAVAVFENDNLRKVWLDGGNKGIGTGNNNFEPSDLEFSVGSANLAGGRSLYFSGILDMPMVWNRALSDDQAEWIQREPNVIFQQNRVRWFSIPAPVVDGQAIRLRAIEKY